MATTKLIEEFDELKKAFHLLENVIKEKDKLLKNVIKEKDKSLTMYKERITALLEGLECQSIDELIEKSPEHLKIVGTAISKYAKIGTSSTAAVQIGNGDVCPECGGTDIIRECHSMICKRGQMMPRKP